MLGRGRAVSVDNVTGRRDVSPINIFVDVFGVARFVFGEGFAIENERTLTVDRYATQKIVGLIIISCNMNFGTFISFTKKIKRYTRLEQNRTLN